MNSEPRQTLRQLISKYGLDLCSDVKRCQGLLRDLCGVHQREVNILIGALRERVPLDLLAGRTVMPHGMLMARLTKRLEEQLGLTAEAALWGVESWALALGIVTDAELEEIKKRSIAESQTPAPKAPDKNQPRQPPPSSNRQTPTQPPGQQTAGGTPPTTRPRARVTLPPPSRPTPTTAPPRTSSPPVRQPQGGVRTSPARPPNAQNVPQQPEPPVKYDKRKRGGFKFRGCVMGCLLFIIVSLLFLLVPYVVSVLQEEQRQQTNEPPRIQQQ